MRRIAAEPNHPEPAFALPLAEGDWADWEIRWFTPLVEAALCVCAVAHVAWPAPRGAADRRVGAVPRCAGTAYCSPGMRSRCRRRPWPSEVRGAGAGPEPRSGRGGAARP
ncbi:PhzF family phenazine biosynthesis protein [Streptomyces sp. NPDC091371]|uniref:PhzF family phenazine biosynthesis protein n=1 Tax=Streptomyces sp. NPDC091371 TaxID=3155303 RepID=UPI00343D550B